jgi:hypothetical protein
LTGQLRLELAGQIVFFTTFKLRSTSGQQRHALVKRKIYSSTKKVDREQKLRQKADGDF